MACDNKKTVRTSVILSEQKHDIIARLASLNGISMPAIIQYALNEFLEKYEPGEKLKLKIVKE